MALGSALELRTRLEGRVARRQEVAAQTPLKLVSLVRRGAWQPREFAPERPVADRGCLLGFGLDSTIEVLSAAAGAWQFTGDNRNPIEPKLSTD